MAKEYEVTLEDALPGAGEDPVFDIVKTDKMPQVEDIFTNREGRQFFVLKVRKEIYIYIYNYILFFFEIGTCFY